MNNLTQDQIIKEKEKDRKEQAKRMRNNIILVIISGLLGMGGGLGSQAIDRCQDVGSTYEVFVSKSPINSNLATSIIRLEKQTGKTWYAKKEGEDGLIWIQIK